MRLKQHLLLIAIFHVGFAASAVVQAKTSIIGGTDHQDCPNTVGDDSGGANTASVDNTTLAAASSIPVAPIKAAKNSKPRWKSLLPGTIK